MEIDKKKLSDAIIKQFEYMGIEGIAWNGWTDWEVSFSIRNSHIPVMVKEIVERYENMSD